MSERPAHESEEVEIVDAHEGPRLDDARALLDAYLTALSHEDSGREVIELQRFASEMAQLPGD
ncbi:MAG: hypothetical protein ABIT38_08040, partial [Gemmatimonadaceae bacterium]